MSGFDTLALAFAFGPFLADLFCKVVFLRLAGSRDFFFAWSSLPMVFSSSATPTSSVALQEVCPYCFMRMCRWYALEWRIMAFMISVWKNKELPGCSTIQAKPSKVHMATSNPQKLFTWLPSCTVCTWRSPFTLAKDRLVRERDSHIHDEHCGPIISKPLRRTRSSMQMATACPKGVHRSRCEPYSRSSGTLVSPTSSAQRATRALPLNKSRTSMFLRTASLSRWQPRSCFTEFGIMASTSVGTEKISTLEGSKLDGGPLIQCANLQCGGLGSVGKALQQRKNEHRN